VVGVDVDEPMGCFGDGVAVVGKVAAVVSMVPLSFVVMGLLARRGVGEQDVRFQFGFAALFGVPKSSQWVKTGRNNVDCVETGNAEHTLYLVCGWSSSHYR
jgi:hypothetical protein